MHNASLAYRRSIRTSHKIAMRVDIFDGKKLVVRFERGNDQKLISGEMTVQEDNGNPKRIGRVTIVDPESEYIPYSGDSVVWYGRTMTIYRGVVFTTGNVEWVHVADLRIGAVNISVAKGSTVMTLTGSDMSMVMSRRRFTEPYEIAAGTNVAAAIRSLLAYTGLNNSKINFEPTAAVVAEKQTHQRADDPLNVARNLADSAGMQFFWDIQGLPTLRYPPSVEQRQPDWNYNTEVYMDNFSHTGMPILHLTRDNSDDAVYNHVIVTGESSENVVRGEASITDINSPLRTSGSFGDIPYFEVVPATSTQADATAQARRRLNIVKRSTEIVTIETIPNPLLEYGDVCYVREDASRTNGHYLVSGFTLPFERGATMTITMQKQRV